jgi:TonB family protein
VSQAVLTADDDRERLFRRAVAISAGAHVLLLLLAFFSPFPRSRPAALPGVMSVSLVAAAPEAAPAARAALPKPAAPPPKPKAKPEEPKPAPPPAPPKPEVQADKKLLPKEAVQAPKPKPKPAAAPPRPPQPMDYDDALDSLRQELGEGPPSDAPDPALVASVQPAARVGPAGGAGGPPLDPAVAEWMRRVKIHVKRSWILEPAAKRQAVQTLVAVTLDATGNVLEVELQERSGNASFDASVVRAIEKASPLPPPPDSGEWPFIFTPQDGV